MKTTRIYQAKSVFFGLAVLFMLSLPGCSKDENSKDDNPANNEVVNTYITNLPSWDTYCPTKADADEIFETTQEFNCENKLVKTTSECSITRTPGEIVTYDPNSEILYLGSLIQGDGYIGGLGSIKSLPIYQRAPISVSISFQMANNSRVVENPNLSTIKEAIGDLVETAQNAGHVSGSSIFFDKRTSHSVKQTALALGLSAKFMKSSVQLNLEWTSTTESHTVSAYFVQKMFTVSMGLPQRPGDLFNDDFTQEILQEQVSLGRIGPNNLPVFVSNIVYGRMMTLTMTSNYSEVEMKAALEGSYNGIGGSVSAEHKEILENSQIQLVTIGGDANLALGYLRTGQLGEFFREDAPLTTAVPLSYTLRNLGDNNIAKVSETTEYQMEQYDDVGIVLYKDEGAWKNAVQGSPMAYAKFETYMSNLNLANESGNFVYDSNNGQTFMGKRISLDGSNTGLPFNFYLENTAVPSSHPNVLWALVHKDQEANWGETISIGDIDNFENDDFEIGVTGTDVYAIGFRIIDNSSNAEEYLEVHAADGDNECQIAYLTHDDVTGGFTNFIGVFSTVPIRRIFFNEDGGGDDIGVKDFYFGYRTK